MTLFLNSTNLKNLSRKESEEFTIYFYNNAYLYQEVGEIVSHWNEEHPGKKCVLTICVHEDADYGKKKANDTSSLFSHSSVSTKISRSDSLNWRLDMGKDDTKGATVEVKKMKVKPVMKKRQVKSATTTQTFKLGAADVVVVEETLDVVAFTPVIEQIRVNYSKTPLSCEELYVASELRKEIKTLREQLKKYEKQSERPFFLNIGFVSKQEEKLILANRDLSREVFDLENILTTVKNEGSRLKLAVYEYKSALDDMIIESSLERVDYVTKMNVLRRSILERDKEIRSLRQLLRNLMI